MNIFVAHKYRLLNMCLCKFRVVFKFIGNILQLSTRLVTGQRNKDHFNYYYYSYYYYYEI